jgi:hypothetical protein
LTSPPELRLWKKLGSPEVPFTESAQKQITTITKGYLNKLFKCNSRTLVFFRCPIPLSWEKALPQAAGIAGSLWYSRFFQT